MEMKRKRKNLRIALLAAPWLLAVSLPAVAVTTYQWDTKGCSQSFQLTCVDGTPSPGLTISAISDTAGPVGTKMLASAYVYNYDTANGHLGVTSRAGNNNASGGNGSDETTASPQHAMDNDGNSEFMLLKIGTGTTPVSLTGVTLGWSQNDSDITVLAYTGSNYAVDWAATTTYTGATGLLMHGWTLIGNYFNVCGTTTQCNNTGNAVGNKTANISTGVSSSYWLVGAYNGLGATVAGSDTNYDYMKVLGIAACSGANCGGGGTQQVPEPSSLLLMGIALVGLTTLRRRGLI